MTAHKPHRTTYQSMNIKEQLGDEWIPHIYAAKVRTQRTRAVLLEIAERENEAEIFYTLLGIELKTGSRRIACPDLATARYLRVFVRLGCQRIAVPYDITKISVLADELETAWQKTILLAAEDSPRRRTLLVKLMRTEISEAGAGEAIPEFKQSTKQRRT